MSMEPKKTVLIVEDEVNIVDIVRFNLQREGYATLEAYDGEAGLALAREKKPDLILLDVMMPKMMGFDVCRALRAEGDNVPVIILTAREEEEDKSLGLEIGADDYITKPFSMRELMARVKANIRRTAMVSGAAAESGMSAGGALTINTENFQVYKSGRPIELTQREYELLTCPPPAREDRGRSCLAPLHPHPPRRGLLLVHAVIFPVRTEGRLCRVPLAAHEISAHHAAAHHLAHGGGGRVPDDQRDQLLH